jgi:YhcH/YjgK/YiaL family protein
MIIDRLDNGLFYFKLNDRLHRALLYLQQTDLSALPAGKHEIEGQRVFALVEEFKTKPLDQGVWEAHRKYLDIHCVIAGREKIGYAPLKALRPSAAYDAEKDIEFFEGSGDFLIASPGTFIMMLPQDAHKPGLSVQEPEWIKKLVMKIEVL